MCLENGIKTPGKIKAIWRFLSANKCLKYYIITLINSKHLKLSVVMSMSLMLTFLTTISRHYKFTHRIQFRGKLGASYDRWSSQKEFIFKIKAKELL